MTLEELERRIQALEDVEEVKKLMATYCYYVDAFQWGDVVSLFADDAKTDYDMLGKHEGKEAIEFLFTQIIPASGTWFAHQLLNPVVTVDGEKAKGTWYLLCPAITPNPDGERAVWIHGRYDNEFVKQDGKWKFSLLNFKFSFVAPYEDGWAKARMVSA